ncbi:MAG: carboxypeptidase regulatory-like domain-containing protein [Rubricoccaceae bacterium]
MATVTLRRARGWLVVLAALLALPASAQVVTTAALSGVVNDQAGQPLPGANVVAVHEPTGTRYGVATRVDGRFNIQNMQVGGPYTITATFTGFRPDVRTGIVLALGSDLSLTFTLREDAAMIGEVEVVADANRTINPDRTGAQTQISRQQLESLPTINRSLSDFTRLNAQSTGFNSFGGRNNLYNNISIDGSVFNNVFGLASEVGGQTRQQPVALDAIEQVQVSIAPYDVRQGSFTGAGINVVTRGGTNDYTGSVYSFLRNQNFVGERLDGTPSEVARFNERQSGLSVGGPILRNRAFFFVNGELRSRVDPGATFRPATSPGETGPDVSRVLASDLETIRQTLIDRYGYDPGTFGLFDLDNGGTNVTARFDANLSPQHRFSLRLNYLDSFRDVPVSNSGLGQDGRQANSRRIPFSGVNYAINNDVYSAIGQLNSTFGTTWSNQFTLGYTALRDSRSSPSDNNPFPLVDVFDGSGGVYTSFGYEPFTANNRLSTDIFQLSNNLTGFFGRNVVTVGTSNEFYAFSNGFTPNWYGAFRFRSVEDFLAHANASDRTAPGVPQPTQFQIQYSAVPGVDVPLAEISAIQAGLYAQNEFRALDNLKLTLGLRMDVPIFTSDLPRNETVAGLTFANGERIDTSRLPRSTPLWSPRLGFNYDVLNNRQYQVRGGTGVFTGKIPFVWISNQASNNGVLFGETFVTGNGTAPLCQPGTSVAAGNCRQITLVQDRSALIPANPTTPATVLINATAENFKFPQVWRTNLGFDAQLPYGFVATFDGIYTADINAVFHRNANLREPIGTFNGADNRPRFAGTAAANRINAGVTNAIILDNTNQGYQYSLTGELQKSFDAGLLDGLLARLAYTNAMAKDLTSSTSAIAATAFNNNQVFTSPNDPVLGFSVNDQRHRVLGIGSYNLRALGFARTTLSLIYDGGVGSNYSYTYTGDMNGDGISNNDLIFVPASRDQIVINPAAGDTRTPDQIWQQLDAFIAQDPYLSTRRGQYAERGAARSPWVNRVDLSFKQELGLPASVVGAGSRAPRLELSFDVVNAGNLLNSSWGLIRTPIRNQPIAFRGVNANGEPTFTFPLLGSGGIQGDPLVETFQVSPTLNSRWQALFGIRLSY